MFARVTTLQIQPDKVEELQQVALDTVLPTVQHQAGFRGQLRLVDSKTGKGMTISLWASEADLNTYEASGAIQNIRAATGQFYEMPPFTESFALDLLVDAQGRQTDTFVAFS